MYATTVMVFGCLLATAKASVDSGGGGGSKETATFDEQATSSIDVEAVAGTVAYLPCNMTPTTAGDRATLVIWYKRGQSGPIYTYDVRKSSLIVAPTAEKVDTKKTQGAHWADEKALDRRAFFRVSEDPAILALQNVNEKDGALYKCRVDFKKSPTRNYKVNLTIILPPDRLSVLNEKGAHIPHYILGPYKEGTSVDITCIASGGRPPPRVTWWQENALLDESFEILPDRKVRNVLHLERLDRHHLNTVFTCQASNNHMVPPISSAVTMDMILRPLSVKMVGENRPISAEIPVNVSCRVIGAKPPPIVSWWKDSTQLSDAKQTTSADGNMTVSVLTFTPKIQDSDKMLSCHAESAISETNTGFTRTDSKRQKSANDIVSSNEWKLNVLHVPVVNLELGSNINASAIKEGVDVYFECNIKSNPWVYRVTWRHNGKPLNNNPAAGTIVSNQSLVLQSVTRDRAGIYTCVGSNQEGDGVSNPVNLDVKFAPICRPGQETVQGVGRREAAKVVCEVEANPSDHLEYVWRFNNSRETVRLERDRYTEDGPRSTAAYTPQTPLDYGTLMCWASNEYGKQSTPCVYQVIAAGRPDSVENCTVQNQTATTLTVRCQPGFDGGLSQRFVMEVYDRHAQTLAGNVTADEPKFTVGGLKSGIGFDVSLYAYNVRGASDPVQLHSHTLKSAEKRTAISPATKFTPMLAVIVVGSIALVLTIACVIGAIIACQRKRCQTRRQERERSADESKTAIGSVSDHRSETSDDGLDKNPDIIPHDNEYLDEEEKAFERLNSNQNRLYSSCNAEQDPCKQQTRGIPQPQQQQQQQQQQQLQPLPQQFQYGDMAGGPMQSPQLQPQQPIAAAMYPTLMCSVPQQQPVSILRHANDPHGVVQYVPVEQSRVLLNHHQQQLHPHHVLLHHQQQQPYHTQMRGPGPNAMGNRQFHDRSVEIPLLLTPPASHQRESTSECMMEQREATGRQVFGNPSPQSQIVAATRF